MNKQTNNGDIDFSICKLCDIAVSITSSTYLRFSNSSHDLILSRSKIFDKLSMNGFLGEEDASLVDIDFDVYGKSAKSNRLEEVEEQ